MSGWEQLLDDMFEAIIEIIFDWSIGIAVTILIISLFIWIIF